MKRISPTNEDDPVSEERCEHCAATFDRKDTIAATFPGLPSLFRCPECEQWTEEEL